MISGEVAEVDIGSESGESGGTGEEAKKGRRFYRLKVR